MSRISSRTRVEHEPARSFASPTWKKRRCFFEPSERSLSPHLPCPHLPHGDEEDGAGVVHGGPTSGGDGGSASSASVLAEWNSYAAARSAEEEGGVGFDIEAAVRTANDKFAGTLNVFSKGVTELPGRFQSATSSVPSGKSLIYGAAAPEICHLFHAWLCLYCWIVFALKGAKYQLAHMASKERLPFTLGFVGSMIGTIYVSVVLHSYVLSVFFSVLQVVALAYYAISYFPGGSAGLKLISSTFTSSVLKCFGR
uniref:Vesicle transport protein n=1 Tax=Ananas comosus var. bracteatus TaxID=296719 RepID=A0A6V7PLP2_ANACO|nr:unnamed protein product [Ananas comosus var. bracteatus]